MSVPTPIRPTVRRRAALNRFVGWTLALAAGTALTWLAGAMLTGATALAATPAAGATAGRDRAATTVTGQPTTGQPAATGPATLLAPAGPATVSGPAATTATGSAAATGPATQPASTVAATAGRPAAAPAPASSVWDRIAKCESGGNWKTRTGNGYHGGLQFKASTWRSFGGTKYAPTADKATKAQQIEIAEKVQDKQGWKAWPACSKKAGITKTSKTSKKTDQHKNDHKADHRKADHKASSKNTKKTSEKSDKAGKKSTSLTPRTKAQRGATQHRINTVPTLPKTPGGPVTVAAGDTLAKIAKDNKLPGGWQQLVEANKQQVSNPNLIRPGQQLTLPAAK